jgi:RNA polymerase sigma factor (sigma-70 family)
VDPRDSAAIFATTRWSLVRAAGCGSSASAQEALEQLCRAYWPPVYAFARRTGHNPEDSRDLTQSFFARLISTRSMDRANPAQGRFRSFLLGAFKHFLADEHDRELTQKRGGHVEFLPLDLALTECRFGGEASTCATPDRAFDRAWALAIIDHALSRLREEFEMSGRMPLFEGLKGFLTGDKAFASYQSAAAQLQITEGAAKMTVTRMRQRFRALVRQELSQTVQTSAELEDELRDFADILRGP